MNSMARRMFELVEPIGVIPYSADEPNEAMFALGFTNYWDTYFAGRAAPLGFVAAEVVDALFYNFAPGEVARHIPKLWRTTTPDAALAARQAGCVKALRRILGDHVDGVAGSNSGWKHSPTTSRRSPTKASSRASSTSSWPRSSRSPRCSSPPRTGRRSRLFGSRPVRMRSQGPARCDCAATPARSRRGRGCARATPGSATGGPRGRRPRRRARRTTCPRSVASPRRPRRRRARSARRRRRPQP